MTWSDDAVRERSPWGSTCRVAYGYRFLTSESGRLESGLNIYSDYLGGVATGEEERTSLVKMPSLVTMSIFSVTMI